MWYKLQYGVEALEMCNILDMALEPEVLFP